ncbi:MAG: extracellular solute-binding protein [Treponema sp.]|jgi:putative aldouronate transport system substrate-binding protein|nr:extracellular solute-binding protein [Treponema sp.]
MKKRIAFVSALFLAGALLFAGARQQQQAPAAGGLPAGFNAAGLPIVSSPVTINVMQVRYRFHGSGNVFNSFYSQLERDTNVFVNWETRYTTDFNEQRGLMLASGDLPEAIWGSTGWTKEVIEQNKAQFLPLDDLIDKYMPNLKALMAKDPSIKRFITYNDGKIYSFPGKLPLRPLAATGIFINKTWLDKLGLGIPQTTAELASTLKAFKTRDPNGNGKADEIPWYTIWGVPTDFRYELTSPYGAWAEWLVDNGKAFHVAITDQFRQGLEWVIDLYKAGVFPTEYFTMSSDQFYATGSDTSVQRFGFLYDWVADATIGQNSKDFVAMPPVQAPDGKRYAAPLNEGIRPLEFMITAKCKNPEVVARWVDQFYTPDATFQKTFGPFNVTTRKEADGTYVELPLSETSSMYNSIGGLDARKWIVGSGDCGPGYWPDGTPTKSDDPKINLDHIYIPHLDPRAQPAGLMTLPTAELTAELAALDVPIKNYIISTTSDWIAKGAITNWDGYVAQLKAMGIDRYIALRQMQYDATVNFK